MEITDGANHLRELLNTCDDPIEAIRSFQTANSIQLPTLNPALKLLDLHGVRRSEYHELALNDVTERLLARLRTLGETKTKQSCKLLEQQLERCFSLYRVPQIRPVVLENLVQLPKVPDRFLKVIVADNDFYNACAVSVRQQIWLKNDTLFLSAIVPLLDSYIAKKEKILRNVDCGATAHFFINETTKARRQWSEIQDLITIVGEREALYDRLLQVVRQRLVDTRNVHYCSLRLELIMTAHDQNLEAIIKLDPCHDFAWCLDACVRDKHLDAQQALKLKAILDTNRKGTEQIWGDLAMIAGDVHVVHFITSLVIKVIKDSAIHGQLARETVHLQLLLRLMILGTSALPILNQDQIGEIAVDTILFTKFLPDLMTMAVEDICRIDLQRASDDIVDEYPHSDFLSIPTENLNSFVKSDLICAMIWLHYTLDMLPTKKRTGVRLGLARYIALLPKLKEKLAYADQWLHLIVSKLIQCNSFDSLLSTGNDDTSIALIDQFLLKGITINIGVKYHLLRLINFLHVSIGETKTRIMLDALSPDNIFVDDTNRSVDYEHYSLIYTKIANKVENRSNVSDI